MLDIKLKLTCIIYIEENFSIPRFKIHIHTFLKFFNRCRQFDLEELEFTGPDGTPFTGFIDDNYCNERYDRPGNLESFCEVYCHIDGSCTETVKKRQCSCYEGSGSEPESEVQHKCATVEYQVCEIF